MLRIIAIVRFLFHFILFYRCWIIWEKDAKKWRKAENWRIGTNWLTPEPRYNNRNKPKKKRGCSLPFVPAAPHIRSSSFVRFLQSLRSSSSSPHKTYTFLPPAAAPPLTADRRPPPALTVGRRPFDCRSFSVLFRFPFTKQLHTTLLHHHRGRRPLPWVSSSTLPSAAGHRRRRLFAARYSVFDPQPSPLRFFFKIFGFNSRNTHLIIVSDEELVSMGFNLWL